MTGCTRQMVSMDISELAAHRQQAPPPNFGKAVMPRLSLPGMLLSLETLHQVPQMVCVGDGRSIYELQCMPLLLAAPTPNHRRAAPP